ncbi:MAG: N-acetylmuramoyl-L-alanine amidase [Bacteroidales bacterium]|nr:N-acetylmuramoyl-L-alanine amidase [Bacteroidales bacterium]
MKISDNKLTGDKVSYVSSPNTSGKYGTGLPDTIIIHYTAGPSAESSVNTFKVKASEVSAHLVVDFDGSVVQMVDFDTIAWHAGRSAFQDRVKLNRYSIGIEIVNPGILKKVGDKYQAWYGKLYDASEVIEAIHRNETSPRFWYVYREEQINAVMEICRLLKETYNIKYILGHEEVSPGRKQDPGPAFPLNKLRDRILNKRSDDDNDDDDFTPTKGDVTASSLNIREEPLPTAEKVAKPLLAGTKVDILAESNGWYKVKTEITGWVAGKYIKPQD